MSIISLANHRKGVVRNLRSHGIEDLDSCSFDKPPAGVRAIGIDLGTTNTVVSFFEPGNDSPVTLEFAGQDLIPSVLGWKNGHVFVGHDALLHIDDQNGDLIRSTKRHIAKKSKSTLGQQLNTFRSGDREFTAVEAATEILRHVAKHPVLIDEKEKFGSIWAVITVPAHFDDAARRATVEAAHLAGIQVLRIINEPTAAALAYSFLDDMTTSGMHLRDASEDLVVFDLGGGTFDVSVVHRDGLVFKVLASEGDMGLGGDDIDDLVAKVLIEKVTPDFVSRRIKKGTPMYGQLLSYAREIKHRLCEEGIFSVSGQIGAGELSANLSRDQFEALSAPLLERTLYLTEQAIHMAGRGYNSISRILLVGGSTRPPLIRRMLETYFEGVSVDSRLEPDQAVSWGASLQAAIILGIAPDIVLVDVCNHTLGIGVVDDASMVHEHYRDVREKLGVPSDAKEEDLQELLGERLDDFHAELQKLLRVAPIIKRNSPLPAKKSEFFTTLYENQPAVQVIIAQGEGDTVGDNTFIGSFIFRLSQPCPKGSKCEIQLTYDVNGIVQVYAKQIGTENATEAQFESGLLVDPGKEIRSEDFGTVHALSAKFGKMAGVLERSSKPDASEEPEIFNAMLLRSKKVLKKIPVSHSDRELLETLVADYESALRQELVGKGDEDLLESVEERLAELISRWD